MNETSNENNKHDDSVWPTDDVLAYLKANEDNFETDQLTGLQTTLKDFHSLYPSIVHVEQQRHDNNNNKPT